MNLTVESSGDPHLLSWAMLGVVRQPRNEIVATKSTVRDIYYPNRTAELTRAIVLLRRLTRHKISDRQLAKACHAVKVWRANAENVNRSLARDSLQRLVRRLGHDLEA